MNRKILIGFATCALPLLAQVGGVPWVVEPFQNPSSPSATTMRLGDAYSRGTSLLDAGRYDEALKAFSSVDSGTHADGALYWKAYCLAKLGRRDEALAAITQLRQNHKNSHWLDDAKVLEAEVRQGTGRSAAEDASNEDLKLMALNSTLASDPDRGLPLLEKLLKSNATPKLKDRALFVLTQSSAPRAQQLLIDIAKGGSNPDLQMKALRYIGMSGSAEAKRQLASIYTASSDLDVKKSIIRSLMMSGARDRIFELAKSEKNTDLRREAIRQLGMMGGSSELRQLYTAEQDSDNRKAIIQSLMMTGSADQLMEIATNEKDPNLRGEAIRNLAFMHKTPVNLYSGGDAKAKREIINGLFISGDAKALVDLARKEQDPEMKRRIVSQLSNMHNKEAMDYMLEILK